MWVLKSKCTCNTVIFCFSTVTFTEGKSCSITGFIVFPLTSSSCPLRHRPWESRPPDSAAWRRVAAVFYPRCGIDALQNTQVILLTESGEMKNGLWSCFRCFPTWQRKLYRHKVELRPNLGRLGVCPTFKWDWGRFQSSQWTSGRLYPLTFGGRKDMLVEIKENRTRCTFIALVCFVFFIKRFVAFTLVSLQLFICENEIKGTVPFNGIKLLDTPVQFLPGVDTLITISR